MTPQELITRFPEIPRDLQAEPVLAEFAEKFDPLLRQALKPSACSTQHEARNHYYLKLVGPLSVYRYGLSTREKVLGQLQDLIHQFNKDPEGFPESLLPNDTSEKEVKGPGCN